MFNIQKYKEISDFLSKNSRNTEIIAISKNHPKESVIEAIKLGVNLFGENRVMEAKSKFVDLKNTYSQVELHLTGPLQSNKVKDAIEVFDVFHTLDREKIAKEFSKYREKISNKRMFIQVNTGLETSKSGVHPKDLRDFKNFCSEELKLNISGLMCIPPINDDPEAHFQMLRKLSLENNLQNLSIGMSGDYDKAIRFKPRYIRLGTILFGNRQ
tara:strand:+ start:158 stop:796 length:639 start_codon:yes stop_codon:yes gene_type:complete